MAVNEKQLGIRLKDPALKVIERRTKELNNLAPELRTTAGGIAKHGVEEYAKRLDRKDVEVHLVMPFTVRYTAWEYDGEHKNIEDHPFLEEKDLQISYQLKDLEKLQKCFNEITEILQRSDHLSERELKAWEEISNRINQEYNQDLADIDSAREYAEYEQTQQEWTDNQ